MNKDSIKVPAITVK